MKNESQLVLLGPKALLSVRRWKEMLQGELYRSRIVVSLLMRLTASKNGMFGM